MKKLFAFVIMVLFSFALFSTLTGSKYVGLGSALERMAEFNFDYTETVITWEETLDYFGEVFSEFESGEISEYWSKLVNFIKGGGNLIYTACLGVYETGKGFVAFLHLLFYLAGVFT